jgi:hypothetical protein
MVIVTQLTIHYLSHIEQYCHLIYAELRWQLILIKTYIYEKNNQCAYLQ